MEAENIIMAQDILTDPVVLDAFRDDDDGSTDFIEWLQENNVIDQYIKLVDPNSSEDYDVDEILAHVEELKNEPDDEYFEDEMETPEDMLDVEPEEEEYDPNLDFKNVDPEKFSVGRGYVESPDTFKESVDDEKVEDGGIDETKGDWYNINHNFEAMKRKAMDMFPEMIDDLKKGMFEDGAEDFDDEDYNDDEDFDDELVEKYATPEEKLLLENNNLKYYYLEGFGNFSHTYGWDSGKYYSVNKVEFSKEEALDHMDNASESSAFLGYNLPEKEGEVVEFFHNEHGGSRNTRGFVLASNYEDAKKFAKLNEDEGWDDADEDFDDELVEKYATPEEKEALKEYSYWSFKKHKKKKEPNAGTKKQAGVKIPKKKADVEQGSVKSKLKEEESTAEKIMSGKDADLDDQYQGSTEKYMAHDPWAKSNTLNTETTDAKDFVADIKSDETIENVVEEEVEIVDTPDENVDEIEEIYVIKL